MYVQRIPVSQIIYGIEMPAISGCPDLVENLVFEGSERISPSLPVTAESILRSKLANQLPEDVEESGKGSMLENGFVIPLREIR